MKNHDLTVAFVLLLCVAQSVQSRFSQARVSSQQQHWLNVGRDELLKNKQRHDSIKELAKAKNVILFLGDGMGISTLTAARTLKAQMRGELPGPSRLYFEDFPVLGLSMTYNTDKMGPDSAGTATAYLCGVKTNLGVLGLDERVALGDCKTHVDLPDTKIKCTAEQFAAAGKSVGLVTTKSITDASPTPMYAATPDRDWQGDNDLPLNATTHGCKDIASQLVDTGLYLNVALGGGAAKFKNSTRKDQRDLPTLWVEEKKKLGLKAKAIFTGSELRSLNTADTTDLLGLFSSGGMKYEQDRVSEASDEPSLTEMALKALEIVSKNSNGYFLFIEGGNIDKAHHDSLAQYSLFDTLAFEAAIIEVMKKVNTEETLVIVTADHSHVFTYGTSVSRTKFIFDLSDYSDDMNNKPYTSLIYGNGPGRVVMNETGERPLITAAQTNKTSYQFESAIPLPWETHSCEEVAIYAQGPQAHLISSMVEQSTVAHLMLYATCTGQYSDAAHCVSSLGTTTPNTAPASVVNWKLLIVATLATLFTAITL